MSTVRETSIKAYNEIKESGLLGQRQFEVYETLVKCTDAGRQVSSAEIFYEMKLYGRNPSHSNVATRLGELRERGVAEEVTTKECPITHRSVIAWRAVDALPTPKQKKDKIARLTERVQRLEKKLLKAKMLLTSLRLERNRQEEQKGQQQTLW